MKLKLIGLMIFAAAVLQGCVLTKIASVPMRITGAVVSIVPVAGNSAHDVIDDAADTVDDVPI